MKDAILKTLTEMAPDAIAVAWKSIQATAAGEDPRKVLSKAERALLSAAMRKSFDKALGL